METLAAVGSTLLSGAGAAGSAVGGAAGTIGGGIAGAAGSIGSGLASAAGTIGGGIGQAAGTLWSGLQGAAGALGQGLGQAGQWLSGQIGSASSGIAQGLQEAWGAVAPTLEAVGSGAMNGLGDAWEFVSEAVSGAGDSISQGLESLGGMGGGGGAGGAPPSSPTPRVDSAPDGVPPQAPSSASAENTPYLFSREGDVTRVRDRFTGAEWTLPQGEAGNTALASYQEANRQVLTNPQAVGGPDLKRGSFWDNFTAKNAGRFAMGSADAFGSLAPYLIERDSSKPYAIPPPRSVPQLYDLSQRGLFGLFQAAAT